VLKLFVKNIWAPYRYGVAERILNFRLLSCYRNNRLAPFPYTIIVMHFATLLHKKQMPK